MAPQAAGTCILRQWSCFIVKFVSTQADSSEESAGESEIAEVAPRARAVPRAAAARKPAVVDLSSSAEEEDELEAEEDSDFDGDDE